VAAPDDPGPRLVYADWLDDQGQPERADFLRLEAELLALPDGERHPALQDELRQCEEGLDPAWVAAVSRPRIEGCSFRFAYQCPLGGDRLTPTDDPRKRFCGKCRRNVYFCDSVEEVRTQARHGHCVAVDLGVLRREGDLPKPRRRPRRVRMGRYYPR